MGLKGIPVLGIFGKPQNHRNTPSFLYPLQVDALSLFASFETSNKSSKFYSRLLYILTHETLIVHVGFRFEFPFFLSLPLSGLIFWLSCLLLRQRLVTFCTYLWIRCKLFLSIGRLCLCKRGDLKYSRSKPAVWVLEVVRLGLLSR